MAQIGGVAVFLTACGGASMSAPHVDHEREQEQESEPMALERTVLFTGLWGNSYPDLREVFLPAVREALQCEGEPGHEVGEVELRVRVDSDGEASVETVLLDGHARGEWSERVECLIGVIDDVEGRLTRPNSGLPTFTDPDQLGGEHGIRFRLGQFRWYEGPSCYDTHDAQERCRSTNPDADLVHALHGYGARPSHDDVVSNQIRAQLTPDCECMTAEELENARMAP